MAIKSISNDKVYRKGNAKYIYIGFINKEKNIIYGAERPVQSHFNEWVYSLWPVDYFYPEALELYTRSNQSKDSISVAHQKTIKGIFNFL